MKLPLADGIQLDIEVNEAPAKAKAVVLISHGLAEHKGRYDHITKALCQRGYTVVRYDQRGHGDSEGRPVYFDGGEQLFDDLYEVADWVRTQYESLSLYVLGHSMGGFSTAGFAIKYPHMADGIILSGAMTRNNGHSLRPVPSWVPGRMKIHGNLAGLQACKISRDEKVVKCYEDDPKVPSFITLGLARSFYEGVQYIGEHVKHFEAPVLILHGSADKLVSPEDSRWLYQAISSKDKELIIYEGLYHEIFNEPEQEEVIDTMLNWLDKHQGQQN